MLKPVAMVKEKANLGLFVILTIFSIPASAPALEMSSKRDCAVCHVMWIDDFRTDEETLIKFQPGNVLMKDTQGVVSSEEICYSCHDGYVRDSRYIVDKHQQHQTFMKPSQKVTIPAILPLSNKDEIYCGTCHTAHGPGAPPAGDLPAPASFFRVRNLDSSMCEMCHTNESAFKRSNSHPLKTAGFELPDRLFEFGSIKAQDRNKIICQTCHKVHGASGDKITIVDNKNSELCIVCHDKQKSLIDTKHDLRLSLPGEKNIKQQQASQTGPCSACHTPHNAAGKKLWARRLDPGSPAPQMCLACHKQDSGYQIKRVGRHSHPINIDSSKKIMMTGDLPLFLADATPNPNGRVQCFTCHDVHRWDANSPANKGQKNLEGDASNSFLRLANGSSSALCLECHNDKKQVISTDHNLKITAPQAKNLQQFTVGESGPCGACHIPHNGAGQRLWSRKLAAGNFASVACISCHDQNAGFQTKSIGKHSHPLNADLGSQTTGSLPLFSANGIKNPAGKIQCFTCHDAHRWDPRKPTDNKGLNLEGDGSNSFLRIPSSQSSTLCLACHDDKKQVITSDHNLQITAPEEKNLKGFTAGISGPCSACHIPHNAGGLRLWSKQLSGDKDFLSQLCTGCHAPNRAAPAKLIGPNDHPVNVSFQKLDAAAAQRVAAELPLYGGGGNKTPAKKIACLTCHEPHTWEPHRARPLSNYGAKNVEGNATSSFLRKANFPSSDLCITCHSDKALVEGTEHDLRVTAPKATNLLGQTVEESGPCSACHLAHHSPNKLKLWARKYAPVSDKVSIINALCRSCHSKGNIAEAKIPGITIHPEGKLINNVLQLARVRANWAPIYSKNGEETNVGYISCPTCHNSHQWSPFFKDKGTHKNLEGDAKTSFLRNLSYNILCFDCHGLDALYRYKYFHDPKKRGLSKSRQKPSALKYFEK
jgi:predicted CXXCH cytochrome family protein